MKRTASVCHDTIVAILEQAIADGLVEPPSNVPDGCEWEPRSIPESDLAACITAFRRGACQFQSESPATFDDDLRSLLERHGYSADVRFQNARGKSYRSGDVLYSTNSAVTVTIKIQARDPVCD